MSLHEESAFSPATTVDFAAYGGQVRGRVRYEVIRQHLLPELEGAPPLQILDVGGGEGLDAVWLAQLGHEVLMIEPSERSINLAQQRVKAAGVTGLVTIKHGYPDAVLRGHKEGTFDGVLSHGVAMYLPKDRPGEDMAAHFELLHYHVAEDGFVSVATKGRPGMLKRFERKGKHAEAAGLVEVGRAINNLGLEITALDPTELQEMLGRAGLETEAWYGVRIKPDTDDDDRLVATVPAEELAAIVQAEIELSESFVVRGLGQMLHMISRRKD